MKVLNYGSLNVDYVYSVDHIIVGGETQHSSKLEVFCGGKGLNQSIALAKAGVPVYHAGIVGTDGDILLDACKEAGVNTKYIRRLPAKGGHTMIQVDKNAQNCIILYGGTNQMQTKEFVDEVLADFGEGDYLILQNEINLLDYIIDQAYEKKMKIVMNPSPFDDKLDCCDLGKVYLFLLNEIEGEQITGYKDKDQILDAMADKFPHARFVLTLGSDGAVYYKSISGYFQGKSSGYHCGGRYVYRIFYCGHNRWKKCTGSTENGGKSVFYCSFKAGGDTVHSYGRRGEKGIGTRLRSTFL